MLNNATQFTVRNIVYEGKIQIGITNDSYLLIF